MPAPGTFLAGVGGVHHEDADAVFLVEVADLGFKRGPPAVGNHRVHLGGQVRSPEIELLDDELQGELGQDDGIEEASDQGFKLALERLAKLLAFGVRMGKLSRTSGKASLLARSAAIFGS